ncbi:MAG: hybrid sensor histidine kinase/response regulator [Pirellulales bacterium]|nr:hybrid sensor histidine kinase/response regulator [Pirellulales bacterium]
MVKARLRVLLVEDDLDHAKFAKLALGGADLTQFEWAHVTSLAAAKECLAAEEYDVVLLDLGLPDARDFQALAHVRQQRPQISVVVLTANNDPASGIAALAQGAQDYLYKGNLNSRTLERILRYAVQRQQMRLELQKANDLLDQRNNELQNANALLDQKNQHLAELYNTAYQFVDNVSHEFRTPLTVIKEFVSLIRDGLAGQITCQQREFLDIVSDRTDDLVIMVDDMLDVSKLEAGLLSVWRRETTVADVFERAHPILERKAAIKHVALETAVEDDLPVVYCDPEKVGRVIINLMTNAIKFCGDGGCVKLWGQRHEELPEVRIGITDDGPGITPENLQVIFDRFRQVEGVARSGTKGFGLGLSIAKELVHLNLGTIHVQSQPGAGSTFWFTLPVWKPDELVLRYVERTRHLGDATAQATLLVAAMEPPVEPSVSHTMDELLQHLFHGTDLVLRVLPHKWVVVAKCHRNEVDRMLARVQSTLTEADRNRPGAVLPRIDLCAQGTWNIEEQADDLVDHCRVELHCEPKAPPSAQTGNTVLSPETV